MTDAFERMQQKLRVGCPFCFEWIPAPKNLSGVYSPEGAVGGRCECGAAFVLDETGKSGGLALLDAQVHLCDGDIARGTTLETDIDVEVKTRKYQGSVNSVGMRRGNSYLTAKIWFVRFFE